MLMYVPLSIGLVCFSAVKIIKNMQKSESL